MSLMKFAEWANGSL